MSTNLNCIEFVHSFYTDCKQEFSNVALGEREEEASG